MHDFDFKGAAEMPRPYDPKDYGLSVWRDKDHQPPETVETEQKPYSPEEWKTYKEALDRRSQKTGIDLNALLSSDSMTIEAAQNKLCAWAMSQVGYSEGPNNSNRYADTPGLAEMYGWNPQNQPWCDVFVDAGFITCFGVENACKMTYQRIGEGSALCRQSAQYYKDNGAFFQTPEVGDQVFFYSSGEINHTGIVVRVAGGSIVTVEGNSSDQVAERCYSTGDSSIAGYGRPNWAIVAGESIDPRPADHIADAGKKGDEPRSYALRLPYLSRGSFGELVAAVQTLLILEGYPCGPDGADGDFGLNTEKAVREFQEQLGLTADGIVGPETGAALFDTEVYTPEEKTEPKADSFWNNLLTKIRRN